MILSRGRRYIFIHIPKTGGTALTLALEARAMKDDILIGDTPKAQARKGRLAGAVSGARLRKHSTMAEIGALASAPEIETFFKLTIVRNPWDRLVSYYHWLRVQGFDHPAVHLAKARSFSDFLHDPATQVAQKNWPASAYMRDQNGVERADLYARLEHLDADLAPFEAHLGFPLAPLAPANVSQRDRDWRGYYSGADAELVGKLCAQDIARFRYAFDP